MGDHRAMALRWLPSLLVPLLGLACAGQVPATIEPDTSAQSSTDTSGPRDRAPATNLGFQTGPALDEMERWLLLLDGRDTSQENPHWFEGTHGLRALYETTETLLTQMVLLPSLGRIFEAPVFVSGPHTDSPEFEVLDDWGHHNPDFVANVLDTAMALADDPARIARTQDAFDNQLRGQATTYLLVYDAIHHDPEWFEGFANSYRQAIGTYDTTAVYYDELDPMNNGLEARGMSWYEANTAAYFWVRRELDGTASLWRAVLQAVLDAYGALDGVEPAPLPHSARSRV